MKKNLFRKFLSLTIALLLLLALPVQALAAEYDIGQGSVTITAGGGSQTVNHGGTDKGVDSNPVVTGSSTTNTVTITGSGEAKVTLKDASIDVSSDSSKGPAVKVDSGVEATVNLQGNNEVKSGSNHAGMEVETGAAVTIDGSGFLTATGGGTAAGIGGGYEGSGGDITINGGGVTATGGIYGAGIGGGSYGSGGNTVINGGNVTATGGFGGAGIGGGYHGDGADVTISGGRVSATGGENGADIGAGQYADDEGTLTHTGGEIYYGEPLPEKEPEPEPEPEPKPEPKPEKPVKPQKAEKQVEDSLWARLLQQIQAAQPGSEVKVNFGHRDWIPVFILEAMAEYDVTLLISRDGQADVTLKPGVEYSTKSWSVKIDSLID